VETSRPIIEAGGHTLSVELPSLPVPLDADAVRLAQVFANLLGNAAKYTEQGGNIELKAWRHGNEVVISVRDSGIGIAAENLSRVFEMFSQAQPASIRSQGGLGIGLSLSKGVVELHGGSIEARSEGPGHGSEFMVRLPVPTDAPAPEEAPSASATGMATTRRILVVDDNRDAADSLAILLRSMGNEVTTAYDGEVAAELAEQNRPEVVLLDIGMPNMDGLDACRRMRNQPWGASLHIIAMTGWGQQEDRRRTGDAGFDFHLVKPVDPAELLKLLAALPVDPPGGPSPR
jgi:CheY-like chemotaxis protein